MLTVLLSFDLFIIIFLILLVLLQHNEGGVLGGLSGGSGQNFMTGRAVATTLGRVTAVLGGLFMGISLLIAVIAAHQKRASSLLDDLEAAPQIEPLKKAPAKTVAAPVARQK